MIALIEDREEDAELIQEAFDPFLEREKESLLWFSDPENFIGYSEKSNIKDLKLIVSDLKMNQMDGFDLLQYLEKNDEMKHIPVVILSTSEERRDIIKSYEYGANGYVSKPVDLKVLRQRIESISNFWIKVNRTVEG